MSKKEYMFFLGLLFFTQTIFAQTYGLKFNNQNVTFDKRTELNLTPNNFLKFHDEFEIAFDYKTTYLATSPKSNLFGYIFRVINETDENIDLLLAPSPSLGLNLVIGKSNAIVHIRYPEEYLNNWVKLRIKFSMANDRLTFYTPDTAYVHDNVGLKKDELCKIIFGANDYKYFKNSDVPPMVIRDIKISEKGKIKYHWPLDEKKGNMAIDKVDGKVANVVNPLWLADTHQGWRINFSDSISGNLMVASDVENERLFIISTDSLYIYTACDNATRSIAYQNKPLFIDIGWRAIYNSTDKKIYCYLADKQPFYVLDTETATWSETGNKTKFETGYHHHNSYFDHSSNSIYLFGGYGFHEYKNSVWKIDLKERSWEKLTTNDSVFLPRYYAGLGELNDTLYILGGYGSQTGSQLVNPRSYFGMIGYSLKSNRFFRKFEMPHLIDDMVIGNSFWINPKNRDYYAIIFSMKFDGDLQLIKGNIDSSNVELVGDKIQLNMRDIMFSSSLFYMPMQDKLYAYTCFFGGPTSYVSIYSIDSPPNRAVTLVPESQNRKIYLFIFSALALLIALIWVYLKRKKTAREPNTKEEQLKANSIAEISVKNKTVTFEHTNYNFLFFDGFVVFNKANDDITDRFSPILKELLLLIFLHTFKNGKGISSAEIAELLWYDKAEKRARNNLAVNLVKLRSILEEVGTCEISSKAGYWRFDYEESEVKSDYIDFLALTSSKNNFTKQKVNQLLEITNKGAFLSGVYYSWLDDFKAAVADKIIDILVSSILLCDVRSESDFVVHLADNIFNFDKVNEDAMIYKCRAQYATGKHSQAKATYEKFFKEYLEMYGQEYDQPFLEIIKFKG